MPANAQRPYVLDSNGSILDRIRKPVKLTKVSDSDIDVPHLVPFVLMVKLRKGDQVKILVKFSSHCWTEEYVPGKHAGMVCVMDHKMSRAFCPDRYQLSQGLVSLIQGIENHKCFLTPTERNYMAFNGAVKLPCGAQYKIYFTMKKLKQRWNGVRCQLEMFVESAYANDAPVEGTSTSFANIVGAALKDALISYKG